MPQPCLSQLPVQTRSFLNPCIPLQVPPLLNRMYTNDISGKQAVHNL